jgi:hypothetical protein
MSVFERVSFQRPRFNPLRKEPKDGSLHDNIRTIIDLIDFNAKVNPDHTFCLQAEPKVINGSTPGFVGPRNAVRLSFRELKQAVDACSLWIEGTLINSENVERSADATCRKQQPVALYLESDVGLFIYLAALLASGIPVGLMITRQVVALLVC